MTRIVTALVAVALLAPIAFAQEASELDVSEAEPFMGMWSLSFESGQGRWTTAWMSRIWMARSRPHSTATSLVSRW